MEREGKNEREREKKKERERKKESEREREREKEKEREKKETQRERNREREKFRAATIFESISGFVVIHASQQLTLFPIGFLSLKLRPLPFAALAMNITEDYQEETEPK